MHLSGKSFSKNMKTKSLRNFSVRYIRQLFHFLEFFWITTILKPGLNYVRVSVAKTNYYINWHVINKTH